MHAKSTDDQQELEEAAPKIGSRLRAARMASGFTLEQLARATNLSKGFLSRLEHDATSPRLPTLVAICNALKLPVGSLFEEAEESLVRADEVLPLVPIAGGVVLQWLLTPSAEA